MTSTAGNRGQPPLVARPPAPLFYTQLTTSDRTKVTELCTAFEQQFAQGGVPQMEQLVLSAEPHLQPALLEQLLPIEIDYLASTRGGIPTLHEILVLYPNLEDLLVPAYERLNPEVRLPDVLGVYRLVRVVGSGTQATIAIGRHKRLHQPVAIKFSRDEESSRRLLQEAAFLSRLDGLNVPSVIDDGRTPDGTAFFIMDYLEGRTLLEMIQDRGPIGDPVQCAKTLLHIAETVAGIHDRGIIHRDLTPKNILVGDDGVIRIVDFGLAIDVATGTAVRQDIKEFHGTPAFMAPEQVQCDGNIDGKLSDIYALGRLLLFVANGLDAVLSTIPSSSPDGASSPSSTPIRLVNRRLDQIYRKATHVDPARRFQSANELACDLAALVARWEKRKRSRRLALRASALLVLTSVIWWQVTIRSKPNSPPSVDAAIALEVPVSPTPPTDSVSLGNNVEIELMQAPAGELYMGSQEDDELADADEFPQHEVRLTHPFWISSTEVTFDQFARFVEETGYITDAEKRMASLTPLGRAMAGMAGQPLTTWKEPGFAQEANHPVVNVSWNDAMQFCDWLRSQHHRNFRLPTEAEWEYACRAGTTSRFHFGDESKLLPQHDCVAPLEAGSQPTFTRPVREFPPNAFGLYGMHGNVSEWCADWYSAELYHNNDEVDPIGPDAGEFRVRRGGAFNLPPEDCRSADRNGGRPDGMHPFLGFRIVDGGPVSIAGQWKIVEGGAFGWPNPVELNEDGTSNLGFGLWRYTWNGCDQFALTDQQGMKPSIFGVSDGRYSWNVEVNGDYLKLSQQSKLRITLQRLE